MAVTVLCVGKLKERFYAEAVREYEKRLSRLMPVKVLEVADEREPPSTGEALMEQVMKKEGERLLERISSQAYVVALCVDAPQPTSPQLGQKLQSLFVSGRSDIVFVIGGSLGLHSQVLNRANEQMGLSRLTLPHQLARVVVMEQLYRAAKINAGERYHK